MKKLFVLMSLLAIVLVFAGMASATVVNVAQWRGGENDGPVVESPWANATAVDGTGNGHDLANTNGGIIYAYPSDYPAGLPSYPYPAAGQAASSSVDYAWAANWGGFTNATPIATGADNWGVQLWVRPNSTDYGIYFMNGVASDYNDIALFQMDAGQLPDMGTGVKYFAEVGGPNGFIAPLGDVDMANWHNLALVNDAGTVTTYLDGQAVGSYAGVHAATPSAFLGLGVGANSAGLVGAITGGIDEARVFTFQPGAFRVSDLGFEQAPEPSTIVILTTGLFGLLAYAWRKRK